MLNEANCIEYIIYSISMYLGEKNLHMTLKFLLGALDNAEISRV